MSDFPCKYAIRAACTRWHMGCDVTRLMIVTFLGTKGGTGTTMMAVNCAADIRRISNRATLIADVKPGPGDVSVFLGLRPRYSIVEMIDQVGWSDCALATRFVAEHDCGLHVLASCESFGRPNSRDAEGIEQTLRCFSTMYDFVVVDAGSTLTTSTIAALTMSDLVLLVANPDVPCLRNLQRLNDALRLAGVAPERVRIVLNRTSESGALPVPQIEKVLSRQIDFQVPSDYRTVTAAVNTGVPISSLRGSDLHTHIESMARTLIGTSLAAVAS
jgi:pilus assembly protein CpaE